jgi:hypothetical protein
MNCKGNENIQFYIDRIIGDDGYVEWEELLINTKLPNDIVFVHSENRFLAEEKIDHFFSLVIYKFNLENQLNFTQIKDFLRRLCLKDANIDESLFNRESVHSFLDRMKKAIKQNDIFLTFVLNFTKTDIDSSFEPYVIDFVTYCYVLEVLVVNLSKDEELFQNVLSTINDERENGNLTKDWRDYASLFQRAKINSILPFIPDLSPKKVAESHKGKKYVDDTYSPSSRIGLSINITEAVLQDLNLGHIDNAKAGYELAFMDGLLDFSKTSNEKRVLVANTSSMYRYSSFPRNWSDLYNAWNLVFVGNFDEFPYYAAKLLFPEVSDYKDDPEQYLYPRLLGLWLHIHYVIYEATHGHDRRHNLKLSEEMLEKLGKITLTYAKSYRKFYNKLNYKLSPRWMIPLDYLNDKSMKFFFWVLKTGTNTVDKFEKLKNKFTKLSYSLV